VVLDDAVCILDFMYLSIKNFGMLHNDMMFTVILNCCTLHQLFSWCRWAIVASSSSTLK